MIISTLFSEPMIFLVWIIAIVIALSVHEFSHALVASLLGDQTAKSVGRLTLNPLSHVSGLGMAMLLFVGFGWGKPVPFNPYNLKYQRYGPTLVALAGPISNLCMAFLSGLTLKLIIVFNLLPLENLLFQFLSIFVILNVILMVFNLIPIPPLDGSKLLRAVFHDVKYQRMHNFLEVQGPILLIFLLILDSMAGVNIFGFFFNSIINFVYKIIF